VVLAEPATSRYNLAAIGTRHQLSATPHRTLAGDLGYEVGNAPDIDLGYHAAKANRSNLY